MNSIRTYRNFLEKFFFAHLLLLEDYHQGALRKESVIATFVQQFKIATLRKSYWWIPLVLRAICLTISFLLTFFSVKFARFFGTPILKNICERLFLKKVLCWRCLNLKLVYWKKQPLKQLFWKKVKLANLCRISNNLFKVAFSQTFTEGPQSDT